VGVMAITLGGGAGGGKSCQGRAMDVVQFLSVEDSRELAEALKAEGYTVRLEDPSQGAGDRWLLHVEPFDDGVVAMVDVYGGWLPDEVP
jgi:hypothetical protein